MGFLSKIFGLNEADASKKDHSFIVDIAALISDNDSNVVSHLQECAADPWRYAENNAERYAERGVDVRNREETYIDDICWIGMTDELSENGYLFPADFSAEVDDVLWGLSQLKNYGLIEEYIDGIDAQGDEDAEDLAHKINSAVKGACVCMIDIESDSYELIVVSKDVYKKISAIANKNGYSIVNL